MGDEKYILGIDLGTSGLKTILFNSDLKMVAQAFKATETFYPHSGWAEQNPDDWWSAVGENTRKIIEQSGIDPKDIAVIGVDAMTPVLVATDASGWRGN